MATKSTGLGVWDLNAGWDDGFEQTTKPFEEANKLFTDQQKILDNAYKLDKVAQTQDADIAASNATNLTKALTENIKFEDFSASKEAIDSYAAINDTEEVLDEQGNVTGLRKLQDYERYDKAANAEGLSDLARMKLQESANKKSVAKFQSEATTDPINAIKFAVERGLITPGYEALAGGPDKDGAQTFLLKTPSSDKPIVLDRRQMMATAWDLGNRGKELLAQQTKEQDALIAARKQAADYAFRSKEGALNRQNQLLSTGLQVAGREQVAETRTAGKTGTASTAPRLDPVTGQVVGGAAPPVNPQRPLPAGVAPSTAGVGRGTGYTEAASVAAGRNEAAWGSEGRRQGMAVGDAAAGNPTVSETTASIEPTAAPAEQLRQLDQLYAQVEAEGADDREVRAAYLARRAQLQAALNAVQGQQLQAERVAGDEMWLRRDQNIYAQRQRELQARAARSTELKRMFSGK